MFFNVRAVSPSTYQTWLRTTGAFQRAHPNSIGQLPSSVHANINGTPPGYSGTSGNSGSSGSSGSSSNAGNTGGLLYGD
jgi:hypothetical protein